MNKHLLAAATLLFFTPNVMAFDFSQGNPMSTMMKTMTDMFMQLNGGGQGHFNMGSVPGMSSMTSPMTSIPGMSSMASPMTSIPGMSNMASPMTSIPGMSSMASPMAVIPGMSPLSSIPGLSPMASMPGMSPFPGMSSMTTPMTSMQNLPAQMPQTNLFGRQAQQPYPTYAQPQPTYTQPVPTYPYAQYGQTYQQPGYPKTPYGAVYDPRRQAYVQPQLPGYDTSQPIYAEDGFRQEVRQTYPQYIARQNNPYSIDQSLYQYNQPQYKNSSLNQPHLPDIDGSWKSSGGDILVIKGNQYQIMSRNQLTSTGTLSMQGNKIRTFSPATNVLKEYDYVKKGDLLMVKDTQNNTLMFQRLRYQNPLQPQLNANYPVTPQPNNTLNRLFQLPMNQ